MEQFSETIELFQRQKRFITRNNNTLNAENNKQIAKDSKAIFDALHQHIRDIIMALVDGDIQTAYNYLVHLMMRNQCKESTVWALLDDAILAVIPAKSYPRRWSHE